MQKFGVAANQPCIDGQRVGGSHWIVCANRLSDGPQLSVHASVVLGDIRGQMKCLQRGHFQVVGRLEPGRRTLREAEQQLVLANNAGTNGCYSALLDCQAPIPHCEARHAPDKVSDNMGVRQIFQNDSRAVSVPEPA